MHYSLHMFVLRILNWRLTGSHVCLPNQYAWARELFVISPKLSKAVIFAKIQEKRQKWNIFVAMKIVMFSNWFGAFLKPIGFCCSCLSTITYTSQAIESYTNRTKRQSKLINSRYVLNIHWKIDGSVNRRPFYWFRCIGRPRQIKPNW